jgi:hypothetical protein
VSPFWSPLFAFNSTKLNHRTLLSPPPPPKKNNWKWLQAS